MLQQRQLLNLSNYIMANLYITDLCNRRCTFCYVKEWTTSDHRKASYMSLSDLDKVIYWLKESKIGFVQLIGGEPMLHPDIIEIVERLKAMGINILTILTNGLAPIEVYKKVMESIDTIWLVNLNHPRTYRNEEWETLNKNLDLLMWKGEDKLIRDEPYDNRSSALQFAITFYKQGLDYRYIIDLAKKYRCTHIRYSPAHPSAGKTNAYLTFQDLVEIKPTLMSFLRDSVSEGILPGLECVLPPCIFTTSEWSFLMRFTDRLSTICPPILEVMPNLNVECCLSMMDNLPSYKVGSMSAQEMLQQFIKSTQKYRDFVLPECKDCEIFKRVDCQGYCLRLKADYLKSGWRSLLS